MPFAYSSPLNGLQRTAADHDFGPMLVRAGAGTGKTTVLTQRIFRLVRQGVAPANQILAITYTNAAAEEMQDRLRTLLGDDADGLNACTFHSFCHGVLRKDNSLFRLLSKEDLWVYLRKNIGALGLNYFSKASDPGRFLNTLLGFFERCNDELVSTADYQKYVDCIAADAHAALPRVGEPEKGAPPTREQVVERCREIAHVFARVEQMLAEENVGSFGALIVRTARLFATDMKALQREQQHARMILVDEFQDTNHAQLEIVRRLAGAAGNVFAVGDPDQAIFRFRGASAGAFDDFQRAFRSVVAVTLQENQRSVQPVLDVAYELIRNNPSDLDSDFQRVPLKSGRLRRGEVSRAAQSRVQLVHHDGSKVEAQQVARMVLERATAKGIPWSDFAVLYRGHIAEAELVGEFGSLGIPVSVTGTDLLDTERGRDLMATLRAMVTLDDNVALFRLAMMPRFGLDPREVQGSLNGAGAGKLHSVAEAMGNFENGNRFIEAITRLRKQAECESTDAARCIERIIELFGWGGAPEAYYLLRFVREWMDKPCVGAGSNPGRLADFMDYLEWWGEAGGTLKAEERDLLGARLLPLREPNAVKLMTVHAAKGLEFKHVFIVRTASASFPKNYIADLFDFPQALRKSKPETIDDKTLHAQEERRLFYVAVTRAKDELVITGKRARGKDPVPSRFMRELQKSKALAGALDVSTASPYVARVLQAGASLEWHQLPASAALHPATLKLSASAIDSYDACPKKYYFQYEWRLPYEPSAQAQYGSAVHLALRDLYDSVRLGRVISGQQFIACFTSAFRAYENTVEERHQFDLMMAQGTRVLTAFYQQEIVDKPLPQVLALETSFEFPVDGIMVRGRMDRIDRVGAAAQVLDYKTGNAKDEETAKKSMQLSIYAMAAAEKMGLPVEQVGFYNLENNLPVMADRTARDLDAAREKIIAVAAGIRAGDFHAIPNEQSNCRYCGYRMLCPDTAAKYFDPDGAEMGLEIAPASNNEGQLKLF
ncbi:MAG: ATP-dependent DNA helicase [Acidobacteriaceae bacterium]